MSASGHRPPARPAHAGGTPVRTPERAIVFGVPRIEPADVEHVGDTLRSQWLGRGPRVAAFEHAFAQYKGATAAVALSSCTAALQLGLEALGLRAGDEVIAPTMTFSSAIDAIIHAGGRPVLVDCRPDTCNVDVHAVAAALTSATRAIMIVHMAGRPCELAPIVELARARGIVVIEDCAHAIETQVGAVGAGLLGDLGCFSFYPTKSITTGDGGMAISHDVQLIERIRVLSLSGQSADAWARFSQGHNHNEVDRLGHKANMTDIEAALGLSQLQRIETNRARRARWWQTYTDALTGLPVELPAPLPSSGRHALHLFSIRIDPARAGIDRDTFIEALRAEHIGAGIHYAPVHMQPYYARVHEGGGRFPERDFPNATRIGRETVSLPLSAGHDDSDIEAVCEAVRRILIWAGSHNRPG